jgi:hypothetical protein
MNVLNPHLHPIRAIRYQSLPGALTLGPGNSDAFVGEYAAYQGSLDIAQGLYASGV